MPRKGDQIAGSDTQVAAFLFALARGATVEGAAAAAGLKASTLYYRRSRCAVFARAWREALEAWDADSAAGSAVGKGADWAPASAGEREAARATVVRWHAGRGLMRKRKRPVEFGRGRRQAFLDHFAETCNLEASAAAAGISVSAVYRALKTDPAFADGFDEALKTGYLFLEAEALRQQREAQKAYGINPKGDAAAQAQCFDRTMQLLREYKRPSGPSTSLRTGSIGRRAARQGDARSRWTFEDAMTALEEAEGVRGGDTSGRRRSPSTGLHQPMLRIGLRGRRVPRTRLACSLPLPRKAGGGIGRRKCVKDGGGQSSPRCAIWSRRIGGACWPPSRRRRSGRSTRNGGGRR